MKDGAVGSVNTLFAKTTHTAPSALRTETPLLPVCCLCRLIRDEIGPSLDSARWVNAANVSKDTCRQSGRLPSNSHVLCGVFHAGDGDNQGSPGPDDTGDRLANFCPNLKQVCHKRIARLLDQVNEL